MNLEPIHGFDAYHAHVYFGASTSGAAQKLCERAGKTFDLTVGRHHEKPVGPHPEWSCQLAFQVEIRDALIQWLDDKRRGLTVFIHGLSGNDLDDHTKHVIWLGAPVALNLKVFENTENKGNKGNRS
ncbi:MAG: 4,5-dioxygenase [Pseudomonadales bacterium]|nr:4,5-dioxygenase [Pseudomonadales bacterium]